MLLTVDGAGSGIDADLLDGQEGAYYLPASSYTAADVLTKIKTVDGAGSGLDADLLDGNSSAYFLASSSYTAADVLAKIKTVDGTGSGLDADLLDGNSSAYFLASSSYTAADVLAKLLTVDGTGSGLDADLLDSYEATAFPRLAIANTFVAAQTISGVAEALKIIGTGTTGDASIGYIGFYDSNGSTRRGYVGDPSSGNDDIYLQADTGDLRLGNSSGASRLVLSANVAQFIGTIQTALGVTWDMGGYTAGAPAATGYVTIKANGTTYKLLAST